MSECQPWHQHRTDDLLACGLAGMGYDEFVAFTEANCPNRRLGGEELA